MGQNSAPKTKHLTAMVVVCALVSVLCCCGEVYLALSSNMANRGPLR